MNELCGHEIEHSGPPSLLRTALLGIPLFKTTSEAEDNRRPSPPAVHLVYARTPGFQQRIFDHNN